VYLASLRPLVRTLPSPQKLRGGDQVRVSFFDSEVELMALRGERLNFNKDSSQFWSTTVSCSSPCDHSCGRTWTLPRTLPGAIYRENGISVARSVWSFRRNGRTDSNMTLLSTRIAKLSLLKFNRSPRSAMSSTSESKKRDTTWMRPLSAFEDSAMF